MTLLCPHCKLPMLAHAACDVSVCLLHKMESERALLAIDKAIHEFYNPPLWQRFLGGWK